MASLAQLLAHHGSILLLDAASKTVQVGLLRQDGTGVWRNSESESGKALFTGVDACLKTAGLRMADVAAFAFCDGPGSTLGIRTAAMAIRTWQAEKARPAYGYGSLQLIARALAASATAPFTVIADARRDTWHGVSVDSTGATGPLARMATGDLAATSGSLYQPVSFRSWAPSPRPTLDVSYHVAELLAALRDQDIFQPSSEPDAFLHEAPSYKKWSSQVHSAATAPRR
jgi:tRNA threonylcarbamoyladenosine biosynthesis protein TsaB